MPNETCGPSLARADSRSMSPLPAIADADNRLPVIAARGIADGRGLAAAMALYAGMSVQRIHEILSMQAIVSSLMQGAAKAAAHTASLFTAN